MPNPTGKNPVYVPEPGYGKVKELDNLKRSAPMSGVPALTAPDRAKSRAVRPQEPRRQPAGGQGSLPPYEQELAATWLEIAQQPGASDLVKKIATRAMRLNGGA